MAVASAGPYASLHLAPDTHRHGHGHGQTDTHTHTFNGAFSGTTQVSRYQKGKTNLDFTEARDSEWHWHQLGHMKVSTSLQTDNHTSTPPLSFLQAGCPSCRPANSIKALKALYYSTTSEAYAASVLCLLITVACYYRTLQRDLVC